MKKNILNLYEGFFDDLDKLNKNLNKEDKVNDGFGEVNGKVYDEYSYILSPDKNPEFFKGLCNFCKDHYPDLPSNENGFTQEDLDKITYINDSNSNNYICYFQNITSLDELQYFRNLEEMPSWSFYDCTKLKSVIFPENLKKIKNNSFFNCISLKKIIFPENIKFIEYRAFENSYSLKKIVLPKNIQKLDSYSFYSCTSLKEITIPEKFKYNMYYIFSDVNLSKVNITYI